METRIYNIPLKPMQIYEFRATQEQGYYLADTESSTYWPVRDVFDEWCREQGRAAVVGIAHCPRNYSMGNAQP